MRSGQLFSTETHGSQVHGAEHKGQQFQCPQRRQVSSMGSGTQRKPCEEILKAMERSASNDGQMEFVRNGPYLFRLPFRPFWNVFPLRTCVAERGLHYPRSCITMTNFFWLGHARGRRNDSPAQLGFRSSRFGSSSGSGKMTQSQYRHFMT